MPPAEKDNILEFNQYMKSNNVIHYLCWHANNPEKSSTTKIGDHIPSRYLMSTIWAFNDIENKHILCHGEDSG